VRDRKRRPPGAGPGDIHPGKLVYHLGERRDGQPQLNVADPSPRTQVIPMLKAVISSKVRVLRLVKFSGKASLETVDRNV
jgi:hypothetical protein